jgi:hypothetical protein
MQTSNPIPPGSTTAASCRYIELARWTVLVAGHNKQAHEDTHVNMDTKYERYNSEAQLDYVSDLRWVGASFSIAGAGKRTTFTIIM